MSTADPAPGAQRAWELFRRCIAADTSPGAGNHRVASDDPHLSAFIDGIARPALEALGAATTRDEAGNLLAGFGERTGGELLLIAYPACHHANHMVDPLRAEVVTIGGRTCWSGQGASEGKAPFVSMIEALTRCHEEATPLGGRVIVAVSTEGSSTNVSSDVMFETMAGGTTGLPAAAALMVGTENQIALGHRGRADIIVTTSGVARHSSVSAGLPSPIVDICAAQQRVVDFAGRWAAAGSPRSITPYRLVCGPVAPHTMPERCELALDCRFLPGDSVAELRDAVAAAIGSDRVAIDIGPVMLPAAVDPGSELVTRFLDAARLAGTTTTTFTPRWTFDAGAASSRGIPTILFGPSSDNVEAIDAVDAVAVDLILGAAATLAEVIAAWPPSSR
jgi:succinyl-diaminopimelate desuccinylase